MPTVAVRWSRVCRSGSPRFDVRRSNEAVNLHSGPGISEVFNVFEGDARRITFSTRRSHNALLALAGLCQKNNSSTLRSMNFQPQTARP